MDNGVVKRIDELGRIVIPKDIRKNLKIGNGDVLKISVDGQKIQLVKHSDISYNVNEIKNIFDSYIQIFNDKIVFTDREKVLLTNLDIKEESLDTRIINYIDNREYIFSNEISEYKFGNVNVNGYFYIFPIISSIASIGSIVLISNEKISIDKQDMIRFISVMISKMIDISC